MNRGEGTAGKLMTDSGAVQPAGFASPSGSNELVTKLNDGEGTAGQLLKDKQLYENMNGDGERIARRCWRQIQKDPEEIPQRESEHLLMARDDGGGRRAAFCWRSFSAR